MGQGGTMRRSVMTPVPLLVSLVGRLVLEVLPAALASVISGWLLVHYQLSRPALPPVAAATPASPEMVELVRDEHALLKQILAAQQAVQDHDRPVDAHDTRNAQAAARPPAARLHAQGRPAPARQRSASAAAAPRAAAPGPGQAAVVVARAQQISPALIPPAPVVGTVPAAVPDRDATGLISGTFAVTDQMFGAARQAAQAIGGMAVRFGHSLGGDDLNTQLGPAAAL